MQHSAKLIFGVESKQITLQFESILKLALVHESGDLGVPFKEKNQGQKSREIVPLKAARVARIVR
jgi:hypothetical protein